jgi:hypothetical protein
MPVVDETDGGGLPDARELVLHFELAPDASADLEVVARAALAFAETVREVAFVTDPSLDLRIELISGTEGSLRLLTRIRSLRSGDLINRKNLLKATCAVSLWFGLEVAGWGLEYARDWIIGQTNHTFSPTEVEEIAQEVVARLQRGVGREQAERFFLEIRRDPAIQGVGTATSPDLSPGSIVSRDNFAIQAPSQGQYPLFVDSRDGERRTRLERTIVTLISPVLLPSNTRTWKVKGSEGEMGVYMWDADFLDSIAAGEVQMSLRPNIRLDVELRTSEVHREGLWVVTQRRITRVYDIIAPQGQSELEIGG